MSLTKEQKIALATAEFNRATVECERDTQDVINDTARITSDKERELARLAERTAQRRANLEYRTEVLALVEAE